MTSFFVLFLNAQTVYEIMLFAYCTAQNFVRDGGIGFGDGKLDI